MTDLVSTSAISAMGDLGIRKSNTKQAIKGFYDAMLEISIAASNAQNPNLNLGKVTIAGRTYDFSNQDTMAGTIVLAEQDVNNMSQVVQFILKTDVTYINDLFKTASQMIG